MTVATRELRASYAFIERNFNLTKRYWGWEVAWLIYSIASALAVSFIGVDQGSGLLLSWPLRLGPGETWSRSVHHVVATSRDRSLEES